MVAEKEHVFFRPQTGSVPHGPSPPRPAPITRRGWVMNHSTWDLEVHAREMQRRRLHEADRARLIETARQRPDHARVPATRFNISRLMAAFQYYLSPRRRSSDRAAVPAPAAAALLPLPPAGAAAKPRRALGRTIAAIYRHGGPGAGNTHEEHTTTVRRRRLLSKTSTKLSRPSPVIPLSLRDRERGQGVRAVAEDVARSGSSKVHPTPSTPLLTSIPPWNTRLRSTITRPVPAQSQGAPSRHHMPLSHRNGRGFG